MGNSSDNVMDITQFVVLGPQWECCQENSMPMRQASLGRSKRMNTASSSALGLCSPITRNTTSSFVSTLKKVGLLFQKYRRVFCFVDVKGTGCYLYYCCQIRIRKTMASRTSAGQFSSSFLLFVGIIYNSQMTVFFLIGSQCGFFTSVWSQSKRMTEDSQRETTDWERRQTATGLKRWRQPLEGVSLVSFSSSPAPLSPLQI